MKRSISDRAYKPLKIIKIDELIKGAKVSDSQLDEDELKNEFDNDFNIDNDTINKLFPPMVTKQEPTSTVADLFFEDELFDDEYLDTSPLMDAPLLYNKNFQIDEPENLVSVTSVINGIECTRKANIMEYYGGGVDVKNKYFIIGSLVHRIFQYRLYQLSSHYNSQLDNDLRNEDDMHRLVKHILHTQDLIIEMYLADLSEEDVLTDMKAYYKTILYYTDVLLGRKTPTPNSSLNSQLSELVANGSRERLSLNVCDIEEVISSKRFGLKGNVDVTCSFGGSVLPIELKSSRSYGKSGRLDHRAQLILYQLLLSEIYNKQVDIGWLFYLRDEGSVIKVQFLEQEANHLIAIRNTIAKHPVDKVLGEFASENTCQRCPYVASCQLLAVSSSETLPSHLNTSSNNSCSNILPEHLKFFNGWKSVVEQFYKEDKANNAALNFPYKVKIKSCNPLDLGKQYIFKCGIVKTFSFNKQIDQLKIAKDINKNFTVGDHVILQSCGPTKNTWKCNIQAIDNTHLSLASFRPISIAHLEQKFTLEKRPHNTDFKSYNQLLLNFVLDNSEKNLELKNLVISKAKPTFREFQLEDNYNIESYAKGLNCDQVNALKKCLTANNYALIWGLPGTGKTTTIASLVHILHKTNHKVLIASSTNNAVDNILAKLVDRNVDFLRVGPTNRISAPLRKYSLSKFVERNTLGSFRENIGKISVFAATCSSLFNRIFTKINQFDVCVIDEASQVMLLDLIPGLMLAKKFILVGDHKQLPPIVKLGDSCFDQAKISLFEELFSCHHQAVSALTIQYRMPVPVANICSKVFYNGMMKSSGHNEASILEWNRRFVGIHSDGSVNETWIKRALSPTSSPVIFIETGKLQWAAAADSTSNDLTPSQEDLIHICSVEAEAIVKVMKVLSSFGVALSEDVAVITQFRKQMELIDKLCTPFKVPVQVHTIDRFQGCEKDVILLSFAVKMNKSNLSPNYIHLNSNRLNVALSRPKKKLLMFGCSELLLTHSKEFAEVFKMLRDQNAILMLDDN